MNRFLLSFLILYAFAGCATQRPGLVVQSYPFNPVGKTILIQHFNFNPEIATKVNKESVRNFGELISLDIQRYLKDGGFPRTLVVAPQESAQGDILVRGTITRVHGGDLRHRRWFEVFGFGATEVRATGEIIDLETSRSLVGFSFPKQSSHTWLANEAAARENLRQIAQEIAAILIQMK